MKVATAIVKKLLKSAPPVWAGTRIGLQRAIHGILKSAPPVWAGTNLSAR